MLVNVFLVVIWLVTGQHFFWPVFPVAGWGVGVVMNAWGVYWRPEITEPDIEQEIEREHKRG